MHAITNRSGRGLVMNLQADRIGMPGRGISVDRNT